VPPSPGLFSSFGLLYADVEHHCSRTLRRVLRQADLGEICAAWEALADAASAQLAAQGFVAGRAAIKRSAALHYKGQTFELVVPVPDGPIDERMVARLETAFADEHERTYGHRAGPEEPVELVSIGVVGLGLREGAGVPERVTSDRPEPPLPPPRPAWFGPAHGFVATPILRRSHLAPGKTGPLIVEEYDATCVVPPGWRAALDAAGNIVMEPG